MTSIFNINWSRLVIGLLPIALRKKLIISFLNSCIEPLKTDYKAFLVFKKDSEYRVRHNSQVCSLQAVLNDKFDNALRRIKVQNIPPKQLPWIYYVEDNKPLFIYEEADEKPVFIYNREDYYNEFDFEVLVPVALMASENQIIAQINYYKLFSKSYQIKEL